MKMVKIGDSAKVYFLVNFFQMSDPIPIPRHFSRSGSKFSTKPSPKPKPKSEWSLKLDPGIDNNSQQSSATLSS